MEIQISITRTDTALAFADCLSLGLRQYCVTQACEICSGCDGCNLQNICANLYTLINTLRGMKHEES